MEFSGLRAKDLRSCSFKTPLRVQNRAEIRAWVRAWVRASRQQELSSTRVYTLDNARRKANGKQVVREILEVAHERRKGTKRKIR